MTGIRVPARFVPIDVERWNPDAPTPIPSSADRLSLQEGDRALLVLSVEGFSEPERFWAIVRRVTGKPADRHYIGRLVGEPVGEADLREGDMTIFSPEHVLAVQRDGERPVVMGWAPR